MKQMIERSDQYEKIFIMKKLSPIKEFLASHKLNGRLHLSIDDKYSLIKLLNKCAGVTISFDFSKLNCLEILDLAITPLVSASHDRAELLCTSAGALRNINSKINQKLNANNRFHAMLIAVQLGIISVE